MGYSKEKPLRSKFTFSDYFLGLLITIFYLGLCLSFFWVALSLIKNVFFTC